MQKHKMFLEALAVLRRDLSSHPEIIPSSSANKSAEDFLTAYKAYELFVRDARGFWTTLQLAQGQEDSIEGFFETINHLIDSKAKPTSLSAAPELLQH
jgi:hypothetical protein